MSDKKGKVIRFTGITKLDLNPDMIIKDATGKLKSSVIIGWDKDNKMYFASSMADGGDVLWLLEQAKKLLLEVK